MAELRSLNEARSIRDIAEAARGYAREGRLGLEARGDAAEIKLRAESRLVMLVDTPLQKQSIFPQAQYRPSH